MRLCKPLAQYIAQKKYSLNIKYYYLLNLKPNRKNHYTRKKLIILLLIMCMKKDELNKQ